MRQRRKSWYVFWLALLVVVSQVGLVTSPAGAIIKVPPNCDDHGHDSSWQAFCYTSDGYNDTGSYVAAVQTVEQKYDGLWVAVDCQFGGQTHTATNQYQYNHGLTPDGIVGPATWSNMNSKLNFSGFVPAYPWGGWYYFGLWGKDNVFRWEYQVIFLEPWFDSFFMWLAVPGQASLYRNMTTQDPRNCSLG